MEHKSHKTRAVQSRTKKNRSENMSRHLNSSHNEATDSSPPNALDVAIIESAGEPFSRLPDELVQCILAPLDMQELLQLEVVCKKWYAVIYSIAQTKKSLCLTYFGPCDAQDDYLKRHSFGQINLDTFTNIKVKLYLSEHSLSQLVIRFLNIESIVINLTFSDILTIMSQLPFNQLITLSIKDIYERDFHRAPSNGDKVKLLTLINLCTSLKQLDIQARAQIAHQMAILAPTLARLELFSCSNYDTSLVDHFGANCSRVSLQSFGETINFSRWHTVNHQWLATVTHLELNYIFEHSQLISYLSEHAVSLQVFRLISHFRGQWATNPHIQMTPQMVGHLSKLTNLTELELNWITFHLSDLDDAHRNFQLAQLLSVRTCALSISKMVSFTIPEHSKSSLFASLLSTILPNVQQLNIANGPVSLTNYLDCFTNLEGHSFKTCPRR